MRPIDWSKVPPSKLLLPRRPEIMPPLGRALTRLDLLDLIATYRKKLRGGFRRRELAFERGCACCAPKLQDTFDAAVANLREDEPPLRQDPVVEAAVATLAGAPKGRPTGSCGGLRP